MEQQQTETTPPTNSAEGSAPPSTSPRPPERTANQQAKNMAGVIHDQRLNKNPDQTLTQIAARPSKNKQQPINPPRTLSQAEITEGQRLIAAGDKGEQQPVSYLGLDQQKQEELIAAVRDYQARAEPLRVDKTLSLEEQARQEEAATAHGVAIVRVASDSLVEIEHGDGTRTGYYHLKSSSIAVNVGQFVPQGARIGQASTERRRGGFAESNHVHFYFCRATGPAEVCWNSNGNTFNSLMLPIANTVIFGWTVHESATNYNGTLTKPGEIDRVADKRHCVPDTRTGKLPKPCDGQRNDLLAQ